MTVRVLGFGELTRLQLFRIMEVRSRVFVLEQKITRCAELDETDLRCLHVFLEEDDGAILAYARCYGADGSAHIGRVLTAVRGRGYGRCVMDAALQACRERLGATRISLSSQHQVIGFYEKLGFRITSAPYDECGIQHVEMELG